jgi:predicted outer membrane repeat protein
MIKKLVQVAVALGSLAGIAVAQTNVGGPIFSNTTWTPAGSPYQLTSSVIIGAGATLTIQPGVEVRFTSTGRLLVVGEASLGAGALVARGTGAQPVRFTSTAANPGSWDAILFTDRAIDAQLDPNGVYLSGSILEHCSVEFGGGSASYQGAVEILNSSPLLTDCLVRNNSRRGVRASMAAGTTGPTPPLNMRGCELRQNGNGGLDVASGSAHMIVGCTFAQNFGTLGAPGVGLAVQSAADVRIDACTVSNNSGSTGAGLYIASCSNAVVTDSTFSSNVTTSEGGGAYAASCTNLRFENCTFEDSQSTGAGGGLRASSCTALVLQSCTFERNSSSTGGGISAAFGSLSLLQSVITENTSTSVGGGMYLQQLSFTAQGSIVGGNSGTDGGGMYLNTVSGSATDCTLEENEASDKGGGIYCNSAFALATTTVSCNSADDGGGLYLQGNSAAVVLNGNSTNGTFNTFQSNTANRGDQLFNNRLFDVSGSNNVNADYVCWGLSDPNGSPNALWDFFDDSTLGIVIASNFASCAPIGCGCVGVNYCVTSPNSGGPGAVIGYTGSTSLAANDFTLTVTGCPPNKAGLFFYGPFQTSAPLGAGVRCVDSPSQRLSLVNTDANGDASQALDLTVPPAAGSITAGSVWSFQFWFRDPGFGGSNSNLSNGLEVRFCD